MDFHTDFAGSPALHGGDCGLCSSGVDMQYQPAGAHGGYAVPDGAVLVAAHGAGIPQIYAGGAGGRGYVGEMSALREKIACHDNLDEKADAGNGPRTVPCIFYKLRERTGEMSVL